MKKVNPVIIGVLLFGSVVSCLFIGFLGLSNSQQPNQKIEDSSQESINLSKPPASPKEGSTSVPKGYNRQAAYGYANKWYNDFNPHYNDYTGSGGDCANFVSQCLIAGGLSLHNGTDGNGYGVYPDVARPSSQSYGTMPYCDYLNLHLRNYQKTNVTFVNEGSEYVPDEITIGDVVIFGDDPGDNWRHAMVVVWDGGTEIGLAGHSIPQWNYTFSDKLAGSFNCATFYHFNETQAEQYQFKVDTGALNVRVGPGKNGLNNNYQDIGDLHDGEEYIAFGREKDGLGRWWWHFWFDDRAAWTAAWYTVNVTGNRIIEVDVTNYLNVRDGPGTGYSIYGQVYDGMRFVSDMSDGSWYRFWYGGAQKYSHGGSLDELPKPVANFSKPVMGYLPYWVSNRNQNFSAISHLAWFAIEINADGTIGSTHGWPEWDVINAVHNAGNKVILTVTLFNYNDIHTLLTSYKTTAVNNLLAQVQAGNADGINIDFEMPTTSGDDVLLVQFMQILYDTFKAARNDYHISIASPSVDWWGTWDYEELNNYVDAFMIMAYGYYYKGSSKAGPLSPLERPGYIYDVNWSVNDYISKGVSKSKIILGLPYYGLDFPVTSTVKHAFRDTGRGNAASPTYSSIMSIISTYTPTIYYDDDYETAWFNYDPGDGDHQVWFDNYTSLERKFDYINDRELGGLGIWAYGYQGAYTELEQLIINKFSSDPDTEHPPGAFILTTDADDPDVDGSFYLNWTLSSGADYYNVYRSSSPILTAGSGTLIDSTITVNNTKVTNQISDYYYFAVVAYNGTGTTLSNYVEINVLLNITLTSIDAGNPDRDGSFQLSWNVTLGYDNYSLYYYNHPITEINISIDLIREGLTNSSYHISGITNNTIIYYIIVGFTISGNMSSNYIMIKVLYGLPGEFVLSSSADSPDIDGSFVLTWMFSDGANNYTIYQSPYYITYFNESYIIEIVIETNSIYHYIRGLGNGNYYFIVVAYNEYGNSTSNCIKIIIGLPLLEDDDDDDNDQESHSIFDTLMSPVGMFAIGVSSGVIATVSLGLFRRRAHKSTKKERVKLDLISKEARKDKRESSLK